MRLSSVASLSSRSASDFSPRRGQDEAEIVVGGRVVGRAFGRSGELLAGGGEVFAAIGYDAPAGEGSAVVRVAGEGAGEEGRGGFGLAGVEAIWPSW